MNELLNEIKAQEDCTEYKSWQNRTCFRTIGNLDWYFVKCSQYGLEPKWVDDFSYTAQGKGFEFDYCEHDIIYAIL
jgi:hypothetical protein